MRLILDSNRFIDFCAGVNEVVGQLESAAMVFVPFIVLAEIRAGGLVTKRGQGQVKVLQLFLQQPGVIVAHSTDATCHHFATLFAQLRKAGKPMPTNDLWIAALAMERGLVIYTRDAHFDALPQIPKLNG
jgi:tRNA(fMet)-specific endonuclease VapC